jgi:hypothetical protein
VRRSKKAWWLLLVVSFLFAGCVFSPKYLGICNLEWESYSPERQKKLIADYRKIVKKRDGLLKGQKSKNLSKDFLVLDIYDGKIMLPPTFINWQDYQPIKFTIFKGQCLDIKMTQTILGACYIGDILYLDPSRYDPRRELGTVSIPFSPLWLTGFVYRGVDSSGYVKLNNVTVKIEQKN